MHQTRRRQNTEPYQSLPEFQENINTLLGDVVTRGASRTCLSLFFCCCGPRYTYTAEAQKARELLTMVKHVVNVDASSRLVRVTSREELVPLAAGSSSASYSDAPKLGTASKIALLLVAYKQSLQRTVSARDLVRGGGSHSNLVTALDTLIARGVDVNAELSVGLKVSLLLFSFAKPHTAGHPATDTYQQLSSTPTYQDEIVSALCSRDPLTIVPRLLNNYEKPSGSRTTNPFESIENHYASASLRSAPARASQSIVVPPQDGKRSGDTGSFQVGTFDEGASFDHLGTSFIATPTTHSDAGKSYSYDSSSSSPSSSY